MIRPRDGVWIFEVALASLIGALIAALVTAITILVFSFERPGPENPSSPPRSEPLTLELSHPIPWDITVTQSGYGIAEPRTRFVVGYRLEVK